MHDDLASSRLLELAVTANMVGVAMGGNDILDLQPGCPDTIEYAAHISAGIDNSRLSGLGAAKNIAADPHGTYDHLFNV